ncbi:undecaprenyl-phosphate glucose phosphotransferase [Lysobacter xanthus]
MNRPPSGNIRPPDSGQAGFARLLDAGAIIVAIPLSCALLSTPIAPELTVYGLLALLIFPLAAVRWGLYHDRGHIPTLWSEIRRLVGSWGSSVLFLVLAIYLMQRLQVVPVKVVAVWCGVAIALMVGMRLLVRAHWRLTPIGKHGMRRVAIVGATRMGAQVARNLENARWMRLQVIGCFDDRAPDATRVDLEQGFELSGKIDDLVELARAGGVDVIYIALPMAAEQRIKRFMCLLSDTTVSIYFALDFSRFDLLHARWDRLGNIPLVNVVDAPGTGVSGALKRCSDVVASLVLLLLAGLPMLLIAIGVRLSSPGPILFRQQRYGLNGRIFHIWKFRTMTVMEDGAAFRQATRNDARVTRFGAFLRASSLDELPQLFNVLRGDMALVGPRPHPVAMNEEQRKLIERYMLRHKVRPGITGWAQVNGFRGETDTPEKINGRIRLDLEYIDNWSLGLDLRILLQTVRVLVHHNAY